MNENPIIDKSIEQALTDAKKLGFRLFCKMALAESNIIIEHETYPEHVISNTETRFITQEEFKKFLFLVENGSLKHQRILQQAIDKIYAPREYKDIEVINTDNETIMKKGITSRETVIFPKELFVIAPDKENIYDAAERVNVEYSKKLEKLIKSSSGIITAKSRSRKTLDKLNQQKSNTVAYIIELIRIELDKEKNIELIEECYYGFKTDYRGKKIKLRSIPAIINLVIYPILCRADKRGILADMKPSALASTKRDYRPIINEILLSILEA